MFALYVWDYAEVKVLCSDKLLTGFRFHLLHFFVLYVLQSAKQF